MKKMEDVTRCQVTFSKRRSSLIRKANEISVLCDVDVALVAFSPCGRVSKFFSGEKIEDVLERYVKLPSEKRYRHVRCLEWKLQKMKQLEYIKGDENKLFHLENQIKNLELQIKKTTIELEILQTNLKDYELENEENASLTQILWCEKNLQNTLQEIMDRKERLLNETYPSIGKTRPQRSLGRQTPFAYNFTAGNQVLNRKNQNQNSSLLMQHDLRTCPSSSRAHNGILDQLLKPGGISPCLPGASSNYGFNPLAAGYPPIYHPGNPYLTQQTAIPPAYPPIQTHPSIQNLQYGVFGNSSMHQPIMGNSAMPYVPYQPQGALGTSNLYQPIMPGIMDQQLGLGKLGSSSVQPMRENQITPSIPNQQPEALGDAFLNRSLMGNGSMTSYVQFQPQQQGVLGSTSVGQHANNEPSGGQANQTPTSYQHYNPQNEAWTVPPTSQLQVDPNEMNLLCNSSYNTVQNLDVTPPLNSESPNYNTVQKLAIAPPLNSERVSSEPFLSTPTHGDGDKVNNGNIDSSSTNINNSDNTIGNSDTNEKENRHLESPIDLIFLNSLLDEPATESNTSESAINKEESNSMEWDGFALPDNMNWEDFDILF